MYVKRINTAVKGAAFVELYGIISFSCFLFPWERGRRRWAEDYWRRGKEQKFFRKGFCLRQINPRDWKKLMCNM